MGTIYWINQRETPTPSGFIGDGAGNSYSTGEGYPTSSRSVNGWTFGWTGDVTSTHGDKPYYKATYAQFSGYCYDNFQKFRIGGLTPGQQYRVYAAAGLMDNDQPQSIVVYNSNSTTVVSSVTNASSSMMDISGVTRANPGAFFAAGPPYVLVTPTGTDIYLGRAGGFRMDLNTVGIELVDAVASTVNDLTLTGVG